MEAYCRDAIMGWAASYDSGAYYALDRVNPELERVAHRLPARGRALDLGCGAGANARFLLDRGLEVEAIDVHPRAVEMARGRGVMARLADIRDLSWREGGPWDIVLFLFVLQHLQPGEGKEIVEVIRQIIRPGGLALVSGFQRGADSLCLASLVATMTGGRALEILSTDERRKLDEGHGEPHWHHEYHATFMRPPEGEGCLS